MPTRPNKKQRLYGVQQKQKKEYYRIPSAPEYHTERWKRASRVFRCEHPLCAMCEKEGVIYPAEVTDHIIPFPVCKDFFDRSNWQSLCKRHNAIKGNRDKKLITKFKKENQ